MDSKEILRVLFKSQPLSEENRLDHKTFSNVIKNVQKLSHNNSPTNCSKNSKAISNDIQYEIEVNKEKQRKFNQDISEEIEKLNTKISEPYLMSPSPASRNDFNKLHIQSKLPAIKLTYREQKTNALPKFSRRSKSAFKKHLGNVDLLMQKCELLNKDLISFKKVSVGIKNSRKHLKDYFLNPEKYEKKKIESKYKKNMSIHIGLTKNTTGKKFWKSNHVRFISKIDDALYMKAY